MAAEDGWGLEVYGLDPWGSITFPALPPALAMSVTLVNYRLVRLDLNYVLTTDNAFYDVSNYTIMSSQGNVLGVRGIVPLSRSTTAFILVETDTQSEPLEYTVSVSGIHQRDGSPVSAQASWLARTTKGQTCLNNMPPTWSRSPSSNIASVLTAIGMSDDLIGGSRKDYLP